MGRMCILGEMKAWPLLLVGIGWRIGACADPPRRPPTTYVPLVRSPETPSLPPGPLESIPGPLGQDPSSGSPTPVSSKSASSGDKPEKTPGNDPVNDSRCFKKLAGECCAEPGVPRVTKNGKTFCPSGMILGAKCKGMGKGCHP